MARVVTSFGPDGYQLYGRRMLETYCAHHDIPIAVYAEAPIDFEHELVTVHDLFTVPGCVEFLHRCTWPIMNGRPWGGDYNYRYDVRRFCRKSFAQIHAASYCDDWLYWIDADVEFYDRLVMPSGDAFMYYMGRPEWHSCASFVAWNNAHPDAEKFWTKYERIYTTGTVFALPEWHDSFVLDALRPEVETFDLAGDVVGAEGPANVFDSVFHGLAHHKKGLLKWSDSTSTTGR